MTAPAHLSGPSGRSAGPGLLPLAPFLASLAGDGFQVTLRRPRRVARRAVGLGLAPRGA